MRLNERISCDRSCSFTRLNPSLFCPVANGKQGQDKVSPEIIWLSPGQISARWLRGGKRAVTRPLLKIPHPIKEAVRPSGCRACPRSAASPSRTATAAPACAAPARNGRAAIRRSWPFTSSRVDGYQPVTVCSHRSGLRPASFRRQCSRALLANRDTPGGPPRQGAAPSRAPSPADSRRGEPPG
jgi:hypothetical protein